MIIMMYKNHIILNIDYVGTSLIAININGITFILPIKATNTFPSYGRAIKIEDIMMTGLTPTSRR